MAGPNNRPTLPQGLFFDGAEIQLGGVPLQDRPIVPVITQQEINDDVMRVGVSAVFAALLFAVPQPNYATSLAPPFNATSQFPALSQQAQTSFRAQDRQQDRTFILQTDPDDGWQIAGFTPGIVSFMAAINGQTEAAAQYRMPDRQQDKTFIRQDQPIFDWVSVPVNASLAQTWAAIEENHGRVYQMPPSVTVIAQRTYAIIPPRIQPTPWPTFNPVVWPAIPIGFPAPPQRPLFSPFLHNTTPTWLPQPTATFDVTTTVATIAQQQIPSSLVRDLGPRLTEPNDGWNLGPVVAAYWPAIESETPRDFRMDDRKIDKGTTLNTDPDDGWQYPVVHAVIQSWTPAFEENSPKSYRMLDRDLGPRPTEPNDGWIYGPVTAVLAPQWPAIEQNLTRAYRMPDRDLGPRPTQPLDGWQERVVEGYLAQYAGIWAQRIESYRLPDRDLGPRLTVPNDGWIYGPATASIPSYAPIWDQEASGFRSGDRPVLDVRDTKPLPALIEPEEEAVEASYAPIWAQQASSFRPPYLSIDVRNTVPNDGWVYAPATASLAPQWPAIETNLPRDYRMADRDLGPRPTEPNDGWIYGPATAQVASYAPIWAQEISGFRSGDRGVLDVRDTKPQPAWIESEEEEPTEASYAPIWAQQASSFRTPPRSVDVRPTTPLDGWWFGAFNAIVSWWPGIETNLPRDYRMADRDLGPRPTEPNDGWIYSPATSGLGAQWPAIEQNTTRAYRMLDRDLGPRRTDPLDGWQYNAATVAIPSYAPIWAQEASGFRSADRAVLDVRDTKPQPAWIESEEEEPVEATYVPVWAQEASGFRTPPRSVDVRPTTPNDGWLTGTFAQIVSWWPGIETNLPRDYRLADRDLGPRPTEPNDGWILGPATAQIASYAPIWAQEASGFRSADRAIIDVRDTKPQPALIEREEESVEAQYAPIWAQQASSFLPPYRSIDSRPTTPLDGWQYGEVYAGLAPWPGIEQNTAKSYRMPDRDLGPRRTDPLDGWQEKAVEQAVFAPLTPIWAEQASSFRSADRAVFDVRRTSPNDGWWTGTFAQIISWWPGIEEALPRDYVLPGRDLGPRPTLSLDGWQYTVVAAPIATYAPVWAQEASSFRSGDRPVFDVRNTTPNPGWITEGEEEPQEAQFSPAFRQELSGFRTPDRDLGPRRTDPLDGWQERVVESYLSIYAPVWEQEANGFRSADRAVLDTRLTEPNDGWVAEGEEEPQEASWSPIWNQQLRVASYRSPDRDLGPRPTVPNDGWGEREEEAQEATWWPAFEQELRSYRMPDSAADRYFIEQTYPQPAYWTASLAFFNPQLFPPSGDQERSSFRTPPQSVDVRNTAPLDGWQYPVVAARVAVLWPGIEQGVPKGYRSPDRDLGPRPTQPLPGWEERVVEAALAPFASIWAQEASGFRSGDRAVIDVRKTTPNDGWVETEEEEPQEAVYVPVWAQEASGFRSGDWRVIDVRDTRPNDGWVAEGEEEPQEAQWSPAFRQELSSFRMPDRDLGPRPTVPNDGWQYKAADAANAAFSQAYTYGYRSADSRADRFFIRNDVPEIAWLDPVLTPFEVNQQLAPIIAEVANATYRMPPCRFSMWQTEPNDGWVYAPATANIPKYVPTWERDRNSYRMPPRDLGPRPTQPNDGWVFGETATQVASYAPIWAQETSSFRSGDRAVLDTRNTTPNPGWGEHEQEAVEATWTPIFDQEASGFRSDDRTVIDTRKTQPNDGWAFSTEIVPQYVPTWERDRNSYRSPDRDLGPRPTEPNDGWQETVVESVLASYAGLWAQEASGFRSGDRAVLDVRDTTPNSGWVKTGIESAVAPYAPIWAQQASSFVPPHWSVDVRTTTPLDGWWLGAFAETGSITFAFSPFSSSGTGTEIFSGTITESLSSFEVNGEGFPFNLRGNGNVEFTFGITAYGSELLPDQSPILNIFAFPDSSLTVEYVKFFAHDKFIGRVNSAPYEVFWRADQLGKIEIRADVYTTSGIYSGYCFVFVTERRVIQLTPEWELQPGKKKKHREKPSVGSLKVRVRVYGI